MGTFRKHSPFNLWLAALLSTVLLISAAQVVRAHEVTPSIADLTVSDGQLTLSLRLNVEAYVAGVDLAEAILDIQTQEVALQATLGSLARAIQPSLLQYLR